MHDSGEKHLRSIVSQILDQTQERQTYPATIEIYQSNSCWNQTAERSRIDINHKVNPISASYRFARENEHSPLRSPTSQARHEYSDTRNVRCGNSSLHTISEMQAIAIFASREHDDCF
jgi:hypothetical protein